MHDKLNSQTTTHPAIFTFILTASWLLILTLGKIDVFKSSLVIGGFYLITSGLFFFTQVFFGIDLGNMEATHFLIQYPIFYILVSVSMDKTLREKIIILFIFFSLNVGAYRTARVIPPLEWLIN
jgi:hypothetical protein